MVHEKRSGLSSTTSPGNQQRIYEAVKERIVNGRMGPGETIYEDRLASEFGTSRTPVREALLKLRNDNLVTMIARKGTFVSHVTVQDVYEIYQIRQLIEPGIAVMVASTVDADHLLQFAAAFDTTPVDADSHSSWFELDREFHTYLVRCTRNKTLLELYEGIMNHQQRISILASRLPRRLEDTTIEHQHIIDALIGKDPDEIERAVRDHIAAAWDASLRIEQLIR
jgi:GntR family transcriptional regulator, rspAB operon transcriptional repressor